MNRFTSGVEMRFVPSALTPKRPDFQIASTPCPVIADMRRSGAWPMWRTRSPTSRRSSAQRAAREVTRSHRFRRTTTAHPRVLDQAGDLGVPRGGTIHRISN